VNNEHYRSLKAQTNYRMVEEMRHHASVNHIKDQLARLEDRPLHAPVISSLQKSE
jgi:hypothetical protein